jgi:hypothetical protein
MFGVEVSMEESSCSLVIGELYLIIRLFILPYACGDPLS